MHEDCYNDKENCGALNNCKIMTIKFPETATSDCARVDYETLGMRGLNQFNIDDATGLYNYKLPRIVCLNQDSDAESNNYRSFYVKYDNYKSSTPNDRQCYMVPINDKEKVTDPYISTAGELSVLGYSDNIIKVEGDKLYFNSLSGWWQTHTEDKNYVFSPNFKIADGANIRIYTNAEGMTLTANRWVKFRIKISGGKDVDYSTCKGDMIPLKDLCDPLQDCNTETHVHCTDGVYDKSLKTDEEYCKVCGGVDTDYCESRGY